MCILHWGCEMVECPECGKPLKKGSDGQSRYYCENERCVVVFVRHPFEPNKARIAYTALARSIVSVNPVSQPE